MTGSILSVPPCICNPANPRTTASQLPGILVICSPWSPSCLLYTSPQDNYPDALDKYRKLMKENKWELGEDDEELFEYAMHPAQYEACLLYTSHRE